QILDKGISWVPLRLLDRSTFVVRGDSLSTLDTVMFIFTHNIGSGLLSGHRLRRNINPTMRSSRFKVVLIGKFVRRRPILNWSGNMVELDGLSSLRINHLVRPILEPLEKGSNLFLSRFLVNFGTLGHMTCSPLLMDGSSIISVVVRFGLFTGAVAKRRLMHLL